VRWWFLTKRLTSDENLIMMPICEQQDMVL
jgi:hypothetical protein